VLGWGFGNVDAMVAVGNDVFAASTQVPSGPGDYITELDTGTGKRVRVISGPEYGFGNGSGGMVASADHLFVANWGAYQDGSQALGTLTEVDASNGRLIRVISGSQYDFGWDPGPVAADHRYVFVAGSADGNDESVAEVDASTGRLVRLIEGAAYGFNGIAGMAADGADLFVANDTEDTGGSVPGADGSVTEVDISTGNLVRVISGASYRFDYPEAIGAAGGRVFVASSGRCCGLITELDASTGSLLRVVSERGLSIPEGPRATLLIRGQDVFVTALEGGNWGSEGQNVVAEFDASTGTFVRAFSAGVAGGGSAATSLTGVAAALDGALLLVPTLGEVPDQGTTCAEQGMVSYSLSEFDAATGDLVRVLPGSPYRFGAPSAMVAGGGRVFVADDGSVPASVTELDGSTGSLERVIVGAQYRFGAPSAMAIVGRYLLVVDEASAGVTEVDTSTGLLARVFSGAKYDFDGPDAIAVRGHDVFVANSSAPNGGSVTEFDSSTATVVRVISGAGYRFQAPAALALSGSDLFIANAPQVVDNGTVTEVNLMTGALVRVISHSISDEEGPAALVASDGHIFVANSFSVTELDASTGAVVKVARGIGAYAGPNAIIVSGTNIFVADCASGSVGELHASTGGTRVISGWAYPLACPDAVAFSDGRLFVASACGGSVTEVMFKPSHN
jgi:hypothetical protein